MNPSLPNQPPGGPGVGRGFGPGGLQHVHQAVGPWNYVEHMVVLVLWILVIALVALLLYRFLTKSGGRWGGHRSAALSELELRYARGEIDRTEFLQRRSDLTTTGPPAAAGPPPAAAAPASPPVNPSPPAQNPPPAPDNPSPPPKRPRRASS